MIPVAMVPVALTVGFILGAIWCCLVFRRIRKKAEGLNQTPNQKVISDE